MAIAYGLIFAVSLIMPPLYFAYIRKKQNEPWLFVLFLCVSVVTFGYFLVSISKTVDFALWANKVTYLGQVFVPMCMFMIISKLCGFTYKKWVLGILIGLAVIMYAIVFTTGWLDWYYTGVALEFEDGSAYLVKEYGVLHPINLIYVLAYFVAMLVVCGISLKRKKDASQKLAGFMLAIVLGNVAMWVVEKISSWNFEMLAVSYLMSVLAYFFVYLLLQDYIRKVDVPAHTTEKTRVIVLDSIPKAERLERVLKLLPADKTLTARQMEMLDGLLDGKSQKEIAADLHISESTVKWHFGILYTTLNVSGKDEILALFK
jgi:DNA-binding CsgD family transcriptional regulator